MEAPTAYYVTSPPESETPTAYYVTSPPESPVLSSAQYHHHHHQPPSSRHVLADAPSDLEIQHSMPGLIEEFMSSETGALQLSRQTSVCEGAFHSPSTKEAFERVVGAIARNETLWREILSMEQVQNFLLSVNPGSCKKRTSTTKMRRRWWRNVCEAPPLPSCGCGIISIDMIRPMVLTITTAVMKQLEILLKTLLGKVLSSLNNSDPAADCGDDVILRLILTVTALILKVAVRRLEKLSLSDPVPVPVPHSDGGDGKNPPLVAAPTATKV